MKNEKRIKKLKENLHVSVVKSDSDTWVISEKLVEVDEDEVEEDWESMLSDAGPKISLQNWGQKWIKIRERNEDN